MVPNIKLSPYFTLNELVRSGKAIALGIDNTPPDDVINSLIIVCCRILEPVRDHFQRLGELRQGRLVIFT